MLAELASSKACEMIEGSYRGLRGSEDPKTTTGLLAMRDCKLVNDGMNVTFTLGGVGWQWADQTKEKAGATFQLREYIKFHVKATLQRKRKIRTNPQRRRDCRDKPNRSPHATANAFIGTRGEPMSAAAHPVGASRRCKCSFVNQEGWS